MTITKRRLALAAAGAMAASTLVTPAMAGTGCNGVWNIVLWGCAPWDNNNGSKYPYYKKHAVQVTGKLIEQNGAKAIQTADGTRYPLISNDGGSAVAQGAGNFTGKGWANN